MAAFRVTFSRVVFGVSFPVASLEIRRARNAVRAQRAAELRFIRRIGGDDWRECADIVELEAVTGR